MASVKWWHLLIHPVCFWLLWSTRIWQSLNYGWLSFVLFFKFSGNERTNCEWVMHRPLFNTKIWKKDKQKQTQNEFALNWSECHKFHSLYFCMTINKTLDQNDLAFLFLIKNIGSPLADSECYVFDTFIDTTVWNCTFIRSYFADYYLSIFHRMAGRTSKTCQSEWIAHFK